MCLLLSELRTLSSYLPLIRSKGFPRGSYQLKLLHCKGFFICTYCQKAESTKSVWFLSLFVLVTILQRNSTVRCIVLMEIYYGDVAHKIEETNKSHHPLSASWRCRKANHVFQCEPKGPRMWEENGRNPSPRIRKMPHLKQTGRKQRSEFLLLLPFVLVGPCMDWVVSLGLRESNLLP